MVIAKDKTQNVVAFPDSKTKDFRPEKIWGKRVLDVGFTVVPSILIRGQRRLGLSPTQLNVLLQLLEHWWEHDNAPYPSVGLIAERIDRHPRSIQKVVRDLETAGFVKRVFRKTRFGDNDTNRYDLSGTVEKAKGLEPDFRKEKEERLARKGVVETPKGIRRRR